jgi:hypothetical protein
MSGKPALISFDSAGPKLQGYSQRIAATAAQASLVRNCVIHG